MKRILTLWIILSFGTQVLQAQNLFQLVKGVVTDGETGIPLAGANIIILESNPPSGAITGQDGRFRLSSNLGRISLKISYLGYSDQIINNILISSGKEVEINVPLRENVVKTADVVVKSGKQGSVSLNQMATISTSTIRTDDALRYAGGFYDPSRIVNAFAGVVTSNSDVSNDIVIRGNSSRGLLWRLEGIEIPNPNHFSDGQGGSGGAFSAITSNVIDNFDFFTGAFPAEFGNAISGVMDLNLRKGNSDRHENAFQTGMIGAEFSAEGPFSEKSKASYLIDARYTNFKFLSDLGIIDLGETNFSPRTKDLVFNINIPTKSIGNLSLFGTFGSSAIGKIAIKDKTKWLSQTDRWEEKESQSFGNVGIKHLFIIPGARTYIKTTIGLTNYNSSYYEGYVDSTYFRNTSYYNSYNYPSIRGAILVNHKFDVRNTFRGGIIINRLTGSLSNFSLLSSGNFDTLVNPIANCNLIQGYVQWKYRALENTEVISGFHLFRSSLNEKTLLEPRLGLKWAVASGKSISLGIGLHSRMESLAVYYARVKNQANLRSAFNRNLEFTKSIHLISGFDYTINDYLKLRLELYYQSLYDVPIVNKITSQYSTINSSERLPDAVLENKGTGINKGLELTIERAFSKNYYFLITGSLFDSRYKAGDKKTYNTYYNTRYVSNILFGKDFQVGSNKKNSIGINAKYSIRGGYRFTPVDYDKSIQSKKVVYNLAATYSDQLPAFSRLDGGINFRSNHSSYSWVIMLDVQNLTNRKNVFKKRFFYENGEILFENSVSMGIVPVFNFRLEF
jgi:hypothetical protein